MTDNTTDFFDGIGEGTGAATALLKNPGDWVKGEIVELFKRDYVPYENRNSREPARNDDGSPVQQLVIILQTEARNWAKVNSVPKVDPSDKDSAEKDASEDDGQRAIYVPQRKNIQFAIGRAVAAAGEKPRVGGTLAVKVTGLKDTGKGEPMKEHEALYTPPSQASNFFNDEAKSDPAPASESASTPPADDPWATPGAPATGEEPPF